MAPAPALDVEGEGGGGSSQNTVKSEDDGERITPCVMPAGGGPVPVVMAACEDGIDSSDDPAPALDVEGDGAGGKDLGSVVVKSEPVRCEGDGALLAPCTEPAGADPVGGASSSYALAVASSEHVSDDRGGDSTECSSSFGDSFCETDDESDHGDSEVNSPFSANADGDQASMLPRKKKVTAEWRNVVRPMLWRCQWLELRMKDLISQVSKYDSQLALIKQEKELQQAINKTNGSMTELGKLCKGHENISMERRKRKRHEDTVDTSLYIKKHQILSYFYDKQNKGAETDGLLIGDDSHGPVGDDSKGRLETAGLCVSKEYDMVSEQFTLHNVLLKIGGIQSRVHRLQERLSKARSKEAKMASFVDHSQVEVSEKRQRTQKRSFSYKNDQYAKSQKKKNLNILLEQEDRPALAVIPTLSERATDCLIEDAKGNSEEKSGERSQSHKKAMTVNLLLGVDSSLPNGHMGDLCKENTDGILIDNQAAKEGYQPFENVKHPLEKPPELGENVAITAPSRAENISAPVEVENTSAQVKVENTSAPAVKQEPILEKLPALKHVNSGRKRGRTTKMEDKGSAAASKNQSKRGSKTPAAKQKTQTTTPAAEEKNEDARSKRQKTMNICSPAKKWKTGNSSPASKKLKTGNSSSAAKVKTRNSSPAVKGNSSSETKKHSAGNSSSAARKEPSENTPTMLRVEKAVLVEVSSRRSQRVRKLKIY